MSATLNDPIALFAAIAGLAFLLEAMLKEKDKQALRAVLFRIQNRPVVPPQALAIIDGAFGKRILSWRSLASSICISLLGALATTLLIQFTGDDTVNIAGDATRVASAYPMQSIAFVVVYLSFDFLSYSVTRAFIVIASEKRSISRAALLFFADLLVSVMLCLVGLAAASTIMASTVPTSFWTREAAHSESTSQSVDYEIGHRSGTHFVVTTDGRVDFDLTTPLAIKRQFVHGGLLALVNFPTTHSSDELRIMRGEVTIEDVVRTANASALGDRITAWGCGGGRGLSDQQRHALLRTYYGTSGRKPPCPLPTLQWGMNTDIYTHIPLSRYDEIFAGMFSLYLKDFANLISSKLNQYTIVSVPSDWRDVLHEAAVRERTAWLVSGFSFGHPSQDADAYWGSSDYYYYEPAAEHVRIPVSPFLGSAIWMSLAFYVFVAYSLLAWAFSKIWSLAAYTLPAFEWTKTPTYVIALTFGAACAVAVIALKVF